MANTNHNINDNIIDGIICILYFNNVTNNICQVIVKSKYGIVNKTKLRIFRIGMLDLYNISIVGINNIGADHIRDTNFSLKLVYLIHNVIEDNINPPAKKDI